MAERRSLYLKTKEEEQAACRIRDELRKNSMCRGINTKQRLESERAVRIAQQETTLQAKKDKVALEKKIAKENEAAEIEKRKKSIARLIEEEKKLLQKISQAREREDLEIAQLEQILIPEKIKNPIIEAPPPLCPPADFSVNEEKPPYETSDGKLVDLEESEDLSLAEYLNSWSRLN